MPGQRHEDMATPELIALIIAVIAWIAVLGSFAAD